MHGKIFHFYGLIRFYVENIVPDGVAQDVLPAKRSLGSLAFR